MLLLFAATCWWKNPGGICTSFGFGFYVFVDHNMLWSSCNFHHSVGHCCKFYLRPLIGYTWKVRIDLSRNHGAAFGRNIFQGSNTNQSKNPGLERRWWRWISMFESFIHQNCFDTTKNSHGIWKTLGDPGQVQRCWSFAAFAEHFSSQDFGNIRALPKYRTHVVTGIMCCQTSRKTGFRFKPSLRSQVSPHRRPGAAPGRLGGASGRCAADVGRLCRCAGGAGRHRGRVWGTGDQRHGGWRWTLALCIWYIVLSIFHHTMTIPQVTCLAFVQSWLFMDIRGPPPYFPVAQGTRILSCGKTGSIAVGSAAWVICILRSLHW